MHNCDIYCVGILGLVFLWTVLSACLQVPLTVVIMPVFLCTLKTSYLLDYFFWQILLVSFAELCLQVVHSAEFTKGLRQIE
jgi:hypothetical protein